MPLPSIRDLIDQNQAASSPYDAAGYSGTLLSPPAQSDPNVAGAAAFNQTQPTPPPAPRDVATSAQQSVAAATTPPQGQQQGGGKEPTPVNQILDKLMKDLGSTKKSYGPDVFDSKLGGILGSGISPMSAILFGLGALATRKAPKATAWNVSMELAGLPQKYEQSQQQLAHGTIQQAMALMGLDEKQKEAQRSQAIWKALGLDQALGVAPQGQPGAPATPDQIAATNSPTLAQSVGGGVQGQAQPATPMQNVQQSLRQKGFEIGIDAAGKPYLHPYTKPDSMTPEEISTAYPQLNFNQQQLGIMSKWPLERQLPFFNAEINRLEKASVEKTPSETAIELFASTGRPTPGVPAGMTQTEAKAYVAERTKRQIDISAGKVGAGETARFESKDLQPPVTKPDEKYVRYNQQTGGVEYAPSDLSRAELRQGGFKSVSGKSLEKLDAAVSIDNTYSVLKGRAAQIAGIPAWRLALSDQTGGNFGGKEGSNYKSALTDTTIQLDKLWGGVRGAASPQFRQATAQRFPQFIDHPDVVAAKLRMMDVVIGTLKDESIRSITGAPPDPNMWRKIREAMANTDAELKKLGAPTGGALPPLPDSAKPPPAPGTILR